MAGKGGYQRPANPAAVSGPGAASQRTDGKPSEDNMTQAARYISGMPYGEGGQLNQLAQAAPLAADNAAPAAPEISVTPLHAPTERPEEPVTAGAPFGAGPGPEALPQVQPQDDAVAAALRAAFIRYPSPALANLLDQLDQQGR